MKNFARKLYTIKKNQVEILELENVLSEMKVSETSLIEDGLWPTSQLVNCNLGLTKGYRPKQKDIQGWKNAEKNKETD
jgi:hypothetical protein